METLTDDSRTLVRESGRDGGKGMRKGESSGIGELGREQAGDDSGVCSWEGASSEGVRWDDFGVKSGEFGGD